MRIIARSLLLTAALLPLTAFSPPQPTATVITLGNLRLNQTGLMLVDAKLTQAPPPVGGIVDIEFQYSDGASTITETVRSNVGTVNVARTVSSRQPFPCDKSYEVTATLKNPGMTSVRATSTLSRKCTRSEGTPDLTVVSAVRVDGGGLQSPRQTPIKVRVTIANIGQNMPFNETGGTPWIVQLTPGASGSADGGTGGVQTFRIALQAKQQITMDVLPVALPCGKASAVEVVVDRQGSIVEANEKNNRATFMINGNRCQDP